MTIIDIRGKVIFLDPIDSKIDILSICQFSIDANLSSMLIRIYFTGEFVFLLHWRVSNFNLFWSRTGTYMYYTPFYLHTSYL
jgi:hypothetical protein